MIAMVAMVAMVARVPLKQEPSQLRHTNITQTKTRTSNTFIYLSHQQHLPKDRTSNTFIYLSHQQHLK
jgi:hypothetical protein